MENVKYKTIEISDPKNETININQIDFDIDSLIVDDILYVHSEEEGDCRFTKISISSNCIFTKQVARKTVEKHVKYTIECDDGSKAMVLRQEQGKKLLDMHEAIKIYIDYLEKNEML